jgi:hypothetical protein
MPTIIGSVSSVSSVIKIEFCRKRDGTVFFLPDPVNLALQIYYLSSRFTMHAAKPARSRNQRPLTIGKSPSHPAVTTNNINVGDSLMPIIGWSPNCYIFPVMFGGGFPAKNIFLRRANPILYRH